MTPGPKRWPLGLLACGLLSLLGLALSFTWAAVSVTLWGKFLALGLIALSLLPLTLSLRWARPLQRRRWSLISAALALLVIGVVAGILLATPTGQPAPGSPIQQRFSSGQPFPRFAFTNIVPEIEQVNLGLRLFPYFDSLLTPARAQRLTGFTLAYYQEMERDPDFHALGSAMGGAYADLYGTAYPSGHYYLYIPRHAPPGPLPAIVFLHGSAGNFKVYTWIWSQLAEQLGCVLIVPSFGFGFWEQPGGVHVVQQALADAQTVVRLDPHRIHFAGLSQGGLGVCEVAAAFPQEFCDCILISPVLSQAVTFDPAFAAAWSGRRMLIIMGESDERVSFSGVRQSVEALRAGGVNVQFITYPGEDHFLFFSQRPAIMRQIAAWLEASPPSP
jgi:pimeloyl-ACP methyl ester carboxylesterase